MVILHTNYEKAVAGFRLYNKCFKGQLSMDLIKKANKLMRAIREQLLIRVEQSIDDKKTEYKNESNEKKQKILGDKLSKETSELTKRDFELEVMPDLVEPLFNHLNGLEASDLLAVDTNTTLNLDAFLEDLKEVVKKMKKK